MKYYWILGIMSLLLLVPAQGQAQDKLNLSAQMPIIAWYGIRANEATVERFKELKEAGFTINFSEYSTMEEVETALDAANKVGIQLIIACPELRKEPEKTVRRFMKHPAVAGYFLRDEPVVADFAALAAWAKRIQAVDNSKFCYLNLFPTGGEEHLKFLGVQNYREYVSRFNKEVPLPFLSFDHYPVLGDNVLKAEWYENLEEFSDEAAKVGKDFWAFALATKHGPYPIPTQASLRLQLYSDLVYGAQGLQYFTYWTPAGDSFYDYQHGPIGLDGKRTEIYDLVKEMNAEIKSIAGIFLGAKILSVRHTGSVIPRGTKRLTNLPEKVKVLDTHGYGAIVSLIENGDKKYLTIVNRSLKDTMELTFYADPSVKRVLKDGSLVQADTYTATLMISPGDISIYLLEK
ncbi:hypothetical protein H8788_12840 [Parabacteroides faecis]|uniref:hypothetical protein n=1 Tax=Parabacteroides TaxID=375288 RepID=UPI000EFF5960|nr:MULTISPECIES: hypothetical protein [Parabacteroides]MBC8618628.1 hypothetical protein [Parabacteroides faecis]RHR97852.1 hypothetical protein DWW23_13425 [Parabacteroides sp. AF14-59]